MTTNQPLLLLHGLMMSAVCGPTTFGSRRSPGRHRASALGLRGGPSSRQSHGGGPHQGEFAGPPGRRDSIAFTSPAIRWVGGWPSNWPDEPCTYCLRLLTGRPWTYKRETRHTDKVRHAGRRAHLVRRCSVVAPLRMFSSTGDARAADVTSPPGLRLDPSSTFKMHRRRDCSDHPEVKLSIRCPAQYAWLAWQRPRSSALATAPARAAARRRVLCCSPFGHVPVSTVRTYAPTWSSQPTGARAAHERKAAATVGVTEPTNDSSDVRPAPGTTYQHRLASRDVANVRAHPCGPRTRPAAQRSGPRITLPARPPIHCHKRPPERAFTRPRPSHVARARRNDGSGLLVVVSHWNAT